LVANKTSLLFKDESKKKRKRGNNGKMKAQLSKSISQSESPQPGFFQNKVAERKKKLKVG
jgi:hypothetical protein